MENWKHMVVRVFGHFVRIQFRFQWIFTCFGFGMVRRIENQMEKPNREK